MEYRETFEPSKTTLGTWIIVVLVGLAILGAGVKGARDGSRVPTAADANRQIAQKRDSAYDAAVEFTKKTYVRVTDCATEDKAALSDLGNNLWSVGFVAKGVNGFNAPTQKFITVQLQWNGNGNWTLSNIEQWE